MPTGAPPRAWGGPFPPAGSSHFLRSTPTCVGRTLRDLGLYAVGDKFGWWIVERCERVISCCGQFPSAPTVITLGVR